MERAMTNSVKGEVIFEAQGQSWTFKLGTNAQVLLESKVGMPMSKFLQAEKLSELGATDIRLIFWAGLFRQHQLTEDAAGDLIDELGIERVGEIFKEAVEAATARNDNGAAGDQRPSKPAKARIGMNS